MKKGLSSFRKKAAKMSGVITSSSPPNYWLNTGFYTVNKIISGSYTKGLASGRLSMYTGPSSAGKSLMALSAALEAQRAGYGVFIIDTEFALDDNAMEGIGLDVNDDMFFFNRVNSISNAKKVTSEFIKAYRDEKDNLPPVVLIVDSLDQLKTDSHVNKSEQGDIYSDQGLQAKMQKQFCSDLAQQIGDLDIFGVVTKQPYKNHDPIMSKVQPWIITDAIQFPFSQILLLTNVRLRNKKDRSITEGVKITVYGEKTRFCKPHQKVKVDVPYDISLDPYSGILEAAASMNVIDKNGGWYTFGDKKFQESSLTDEMMEEIFQELLRQDGDSSIVFDIGASEEEVEDHHLGRTVSKPKRAKKKTGKKTESE